jgi:hypothetical protein
MLNLLDSFHHVFLDADPWRLEAYFPASGRNISAQIWRRKIEA